jgi:hypothetical protein
MNLASLPFDALRSMHTALAVPSGPAAPREALRAADVGYHVEVQSPDPGALAMDAPSKELRGRVVTLSFG